MCICRYNLLSPFNVAHVLCVWGWPLGTRQAMRASLKHSTGSQGSCWTMWNFFECLCDVIHGAHCCPKEMPLSFTKHCSMWDAKMCYTVSCLVLPVVKETAPHFSPISLFSFPNEASTYASLGGEVQMCSTRDWQRVLPTTMMTALGAVLSFSFDKWGTILEMDHPQNWPGVLRASALKFAHSVFFFFFPLTFGHLLDFHLLN